MSPRRWTWLVFRGTNDTSVYPDRRNSLYYLAIIIIKRKLHSPFGRLSLVLSSHGSLLFSTVAWVLCEKSGMADHPLVCAVHMPQSADTSPRPFGVRVPCDQSRWKREHEHASFHGRLPTRPILGVQLDMSDTRPCRSSVPTLRHIVVLTCTSLWLIIE